MKETMHVCPVCGQRLKYNHNARCYWTDFTCPVHDNFSLSNTLVELVLCRADYKNYIATYLQTHDYQEDIIHTYDVHSDKKMPVWLHRLAIRRM